jgi:outer membrane lipoprotein-sorting protein
MHAICLCALALCAGLHGQTKEHQAILAKTDALLSFNERDLSAKYVVTQRKPDGATSTTVSAVFRRDWTNQFLIIILEPKADKGKGYLKSGDNLWLYDPKDRSFTFTSAEARFQSSNARNSDFAKSNLSGDYSISSVTEVRLGRFDCWLFDLSAKTSQAAFARRKVWISKDYLPRKYEDYSLSGTLMRVMVVPSYQAVGTQQIPSSIVIDDHLKSMSIGGKTVYEQTSIAIEGPSLQRQPDSLYSKEYLEKVTR